MIDNTLVEILTDNGNRYIHYLGYGYFADGEPPYRWVDYTGFYVLLEEALEVGINRCEIDNSEFITQYITDMTEDEFDNTMECENHPLLTEDDISMETPDGLYWVEYKETWL